MEHVFEQIHNSIEDNDDHQDRLNAAADIRHDELKAQYVSELNQFGYLPHDPSWNVGELASEEDGKSNLQHLIFAVISSADDCHAILDAADTYRTYITHEEIEKFAHTAADEQLQKEVEDPESEFGIEDLLDMRFPETAEQ